MTYRLTTPLTREDLAPLRAGDRVLLSGVLYTGRDAAHRRLAEALGRGEPLPVDLRGQAIYYVGPCPAPPGFPVGSCGPTTSGRVDAYTPLMLEQGLMAMIGKGFRTQEVVQAMVRHGAVYFSATGGAGALIARRVTACEVVAYGDLGAEAIHRMQVEDFPLVVAIDSLGVSLYEEGPKAYRREAGA